MDYFTDQLEEEFKKISWDEVYGLVEFTLNSLNQYQASDLQDRLNDVFQEEGVQYKIVDGQVAALMNKTEADEVSAAQSLENSASFHLNKAVELFNKRPTPDYSNSIKESISAVEAVSREITGKESATLGEAVKTMNLHPSLEQGIAKLYGWTCDEGGIRHALKSGGKNDSEEAEARYLLVLCSALVNFLKEKNSQE
ncbi:MAG: hypothetical protein RLY57_645 [Candidatus Parcubacteria bacterium]|jgi:hypothetical protein